MEKQIKLSLVFICESVEQAERFSNDAFKHFYEKSEHPHMLLSTIYENGLPLFETRNIRTEDVSVLLAEEGLPDVDVSQLDGQKLGTKVDSEKNQNESSNER